MDIPGVKMVVMKLKEWITAYKLEFKYNKQQILTMYLNTVDFWLQFLWYSYSC